MPVKRFGSEDKYHLNKSQKASVPLIAHPLLIVENLLVVFKQLNLDSA
jgi:hypothetical protein